MNQWRLLHAAGSRIDNRDRLMLTLPYTVRDYQYLIKLAFLVDRAMPLNQCYRYPVE